MSAANLTLEQAGKLADIPIRIDVEFPSVSLALADILAWAPDTLLQLPQKVNARCDIYAGRVWLGRGEILVLDGRVAVRLKELSSAKARKGEP
jgi:flagellar motor switch/type III secretory pathway protein FliN